MCVCECECVCGGLPFFRFSQNFSPSTGGGLHMSFAEEAESGSLNQVLVYDTEFIGNYAAFGGGAFFLPYSKYYLLQTLDTQFHVHPLPADNHIQYLIQQPLRIMKWVCSLVSITAYFVATQHRKWVEPLVWPPHQ